MSQLKICPQCGAEYELDQRFCPKDGSTLRLQGGENDLVGSIIADRYHVLRKLGQGGMGQVYLAEHVKMGRKSAVKVMNPGMVHDADAISRFNREAANAARINHPNVAAVYDFGETGDGLIYLAMEFVEGPPLTKLIEQMGSLPPLRAAGIARQAGEALAVAHDMGIVHRDLKPDNIMVARNRDGSDLVKVVDFGIAKVAGNDAQKVTKTGLVVGTPEYMSPEQLAGDKLDGRSDIYSLALVTFNMLTGALPFPSESAQEAMIMRLTDEPKRLAEMKPDVAWTAEVQAVMDRALQRDASMRYATAAEFGRDLLRAVEAMPQSAAVEAGTQKMGATFAPPGAGATAGVSARPDPEEAVPATRLAGSGDGTSGRAAGRETPAGKSKVPLVAAIATVIVLGAGTGAVLLTRGPATPPAGAKQQSSLAPPESAQKRNGAVPDTPQDLNGTAPGTAADGKAGGGSDGSGVVTLSKSMSTPPGAPTRTAAPPPAAAPIDVDARLSRLDAIVSDTTFDRAAAEGVVHTMDTLSASLRTPLQQVRAAILLSVAQDELGHHQTACQILQAVKDKALTTSKGPTVTRMLGLCR